MAGRAAMRETLWRTGSELRLWRWWRTGRRQVRNQDSGTRRELLTAGRVATEMSRQNIWLKRRETLRGERGGTEEM